MKIIENFLTEAELEQLTHEISTVQFEIVESITGRTVEGFPNISGNVGLLPASTILASRIPGVDKSRLRVRVANKQGVINGPLAPHKDSQIAHDVYLYFPYDSDGDLTLYNEDSVEMPEKFTVKATVSPKRNRLVIFDGKHWHSGGYPSIHDERVSINMRVFK